MEEKNKKITPKSDTDSFFDSDIVVSSTECTGLIPTLPMSEDEAESYTDIFNIPQSKVTEDNNDLQHK